MRAPRLGDAKAMAALATTAASREHEADPDPYSRARRADSSEGPMAQGETAFLITLRDETIIAPAGALQDGAPDCRRWLA